MHHLSSENIYDIRRFIKKVKTDVSICKIGSKSKKYNSSTGHLNSSFILTSNLNSYIILAIITGRGKYKHEVGLAVIDLYYPHLRLCQITDCFVYSNTLAKINIYEPHEIIMPEINVNNNNSEMSLKSTIVRKFNNVHITAISSSHFSALVGWDLIQIYSTTESSSVKQIIKYKYYALSAASAVLKYTSYIQHMTFAPRTVKIEFQSCNNSIILDIETVELLEIIYSLNKAFPKFSLYNALNKCVTSLGKKLLRTSILQPLHNITCINKRIRRVFELVSNNSLLTILQTILKKMSGAERLLSIAFKINKCDNIYQAEKNLNYILLLKNILDNIPKLITAINTTSPLFNLFKCKFKSDNYQKIQQLIVQLIQIDACFIRGYTSSNMQRCFAIKPNISELLDIIRQAYCELIDQMIHYVEQLSEKFCLQLLLTCNSSNGYYIQANLPQKFIDSISNLPKCFIILKENKNKIFLTTEKLLVDSQKCKEICEEIHIMSNVIIENLIDKLRIYTDYFFQLCKYIGELDLIMSFATISKIPGFIQPTFGHKLCFIDSYHPIQFLVGFKTAVSNNIVASVPYNFQIITGPNLSGKTTYLKQIILLHILGQIGCFVPAQKANIRLCDRFFFHSSNYYNADSNMSLYEYEVKRLSYIINFLTDFSLITLDEPCIGTEVHDGTCLAVSFCIKILNTKAFCFCTTHQYYLTRIAETFLNVTNLYFDCYSSITDEFILTYTHELKIGITENYHYGLSIAELSHFSESILMKARIIAKKLCISNKESYIFYRNKRLQLLRKYYCLMAKLYTLIITKQFTTESVLILLKKYFSSEYIHILQNNCIINSELKQESFIVKGLLWNNNVLKNKNKSILLKILMYSNNFYINDRIHWKKNTHDLNKINTASLKNSKFLPKSRDYENLSYIYKTSSAVNHLKFFLLNNQFIKENFRKNFSQVTYLTFMKKKNLKKKIEMSVKINETNISCENKKFNVDLFYKNLLNKNLSLCDY